MHEYAYNDDMNGCFYMSLEYQYILKTQTLQEIGNHSAPTLIYCRTTRTPPREKYRRLTFGDESVFTCKTEHEPA